MLYGLEDVPRPSQMEKLCEQWRPYRSVAAWYMWRLIEAKNTVSVTLPVIPPALPAPSEEFMLQEQHQHQQHQRQEQHQPTPIQMIDPVYML
jgi:DNA-3-methyladenine glycosylase II